MMTNRRERATVPAPMLRDEEISQEIALRAPAAGLNERHVLTTAYSWGEPACGRRRTTTLPLTYRAPVGL